EDQLEGWRCGVLAHLPVQHAGSPCSSVRSCDRGRACGSGAAGRAHRHGQGPGALHRRRAGRAVVRVLVTGAGGLLGREAVRQLRERGHDPIACDRRMLDITDARAANAVVGAERPDAILHCAAFTNVDGAEAEPDVARKVNVDGTANVALAAAHVGARFVYVSTDYVFDGAAAEPYAPYAEPNAVNTYGRTKLEGEHAAKLAQDTIIARTSWVYGRGGSNFASQALDRARAGEPLRAIADQRSVPTWVSDAADV